MDVFSLLRVSEYLGECQPTPNLATPVYSPIDTAWPTILDGFLNFFVLQKNMKYWEQSSQYWRPLPERCAVAKDPALLAETPHYGEDGTSHVYVDDLHEGETKDK